MLTWPTLRSARGSRPTRRCWAAFSLVGFGVPAAPGSRTRSDAWTLSMDAGSLVKVAFLLFGVAALALGVRGPAGENGTLAGGPLALFGVAGFAGRRPQPSCTDGHWWESRCCWAPSDGPAARARTSCSTDQHWLGIPFLGARGRGPARWYCGIASRIQTLLGVACLLFGVAFLLGGVAAFLDGMDIGSVSRSWWSESRGPAGWCRGLAGRMDAWRGVPVTPARHRGTAGRGRATPVRSGVAATTAGVADRARSTSPLTADDRVALLAFRVSSAVRLTAPGRRMSGGVTLGEGSARTGSRATRPASTPSNRRIPEPNTTGESAIVNSSIRPAFSVSPGSSRRRPRCGRRGTAGGLAGLVQRRSRCRR